MKIKFNYRDFCNFLSKYDEVECFFSNRRAATYQTKVHKSQISDRNYKLFLKKVRIGKVSFGIWNTNDEKFKIRIGCSGGDYTITITKK